MLLDPLLGAELVWGWDALVSAAAHLSAAVTAELISMGAYARMQRRLLRSAGVRASLSRHAALAYAAHSLSVTLALAVITAASALTVQDGTAWPTTASVVAAALLVGFGVRWVVRRPRLMIGTVTLLIGRLNRVRRRPAATSRASSTSYGPRAWPRLRPPPQRASRSSTGCWTRPAWQRACWR
ncbi:hypothetical protein [Streptosporangium saharense]|uniref:hypothetical protein n=1 Tax=Streptosporangium saharense TaxID=1706840 RepID=UPI00369D6C6F